MLDVNPPRDARISKIHHFPCSKPTIERRFKLRKGLLFLCLGIILIGLPAAAMAVSYDHVIAFGDSLSDNQNVPGAPYTDDDVWVQYLADDLGAQLINHAYAGATAAPNFQLPPSLVAQTLGFAVQQSGFFSSDALACMYDNSLYTVWAGGNDLLDIVDPGSASGVIDRAVQSIGLSTALLALSGARDIMVVNMPDFGLIPAFYGSAAAPLATSWSMEFNSDLEAMLAILDGRLDINLMYVDVFSMIRDVDANPANYGLTSVLDLFYDAIHPNHIGHHLIADLAYAQAGSVPEPSTMVLLGLGLIGIAGYSRRRIKR
jgi:phospholipase/lecithinase/hemolysin